MHSRYFSRHNSSLPLFFLLALLLSSVTARAEVIDRVVAVVNDEVITLSEVDDKARLTYRNLSALYSGKELEERIAQARDETIDDLIDRRLINQRAKLSGVSVGEEEIDKAYERVREKAQLDTTAFRTKLEESGMTQEHFRDNLKLQILQGKLVSFDVRSKIVISEEMILDYYDENYTSRVGEDSYYLLQMGFVWQPASDPGQLASEKAAAMARAQAIHKKVVAGEDFKALARESSELPTAADGGDLGIFDLEDMAASMRETLAELKPGEISPIIELGDSYQFFEIVSNEGDAIVVKEKYEAVKEEIREKLYEQKLEEAFAEWVKGLKDQAYIQKL